MSDGRIVVDRLTKVFRQVTAVDDLSFTVEPGRVTGFLGPNGAGKTTTLRMLLGLIQPTYGIATIGGMRYRDLGEPMRTVGAVLDSSSAHRGRTGLANLQIITAAAGLPDRRAVEVLDLVGMAALADQKFGSYSLGMKQRLGIAAALLGDPQVLLLDEPANGLDPEGIHWMRALLQDLADRGRTVLVSSHLLAEIEVLVDDVVIIAAGKLVAQGPIGDIVISAADQATVRVRTPHLDQLVEAVAGTGGTISDEPDGAALITGLDAPAIGALALAAGIELHELTPQRADLEDVFLALTHAAIDRSAYSESLTLAHAHREVPVE